MRIKISVSENIRHFFFCFAFRFFFFFELLSLPKNLLNPLLTQSSKRFGNR